MAGSGPCRLLGRAINGGLCASAGDGLEAELDQRALLKGLGSVELQELFQVVGALAEPRPQGCSMETAVEASTEAAQMFGHGTKAFSSRTGLSTGLLLGLLNIGAASHQDVVDLLRVALEVVGTAKAEIGDGRARIRLHALAKALQGWPREGCVVGLANEVVSGDHKALTVEGHLKGGTKFRTGVALAFLDGSGIEVIERDQTIVNVAVPCQLLLRLLLEESEDRKQGAPSLPQGAVRQVREVRLQSARKRAQTPRRTR